MTLCGLALAVGILVDEATVAVENIHTHLARGRPLSLAALEATSETALPRLLAMLCILAVFTPALFMVGAAKALFTPLALAVGFSMIASFLLSSTLVPILSVWLMRGHEQQIHPSSFFGRLQRAYAALLRGAIVARWPRLIVYLAATVLIVWGVGSRLGEEIFPRSESGQFALRLRGPTGTKVENTEQLALKVLDVIRREAGPENVALTMGLVGVHAANYPVNLIHLWNGGPEEGWLAVQLKPHASIHVEALKERLRGILATELPEVRVSFEPSDIVSRVMSFGSDTPISIAVSGPDITVNRAHAEKIFQKLAEIPALRDVQFVQALDFPTVEVNINREKAGLVGVKVSDVTRSLVAATTSSRFTTANYWADPKSGVSYNLQIQIPQSKTTTIDDLKNVPIASKGGNALLLRTFASITPGTAVGQYERYNMARVISITANIHGSDLGTVAGQIESKLAEIGTPPPKTNVAVRGQIVPLRELIEGFRSGLAVAVIVIFLLLAANFQSVRLSLVVVSTFPAVIAGVVLMLWITRTTLNIQSGIGAIMALGVAVANAILLVTFAERARLQGAEARDAAVEGAVSRLRPILMTSFAMFAGMLPMALGAGEGGDQSAPLGRAVLGGLVAATLATLFILPAVFAILRNRASRISKSLDATDPQSGRFMSPIEGNDSTSQPAELVTR
jgi:multidrug efflux pump subunit AcrB